MSMRRRSVAFALLAVATLLAGCAPAPVVSPFPSPVPSPRETPTPPAATPITGTPGTEGWQAVAGQDAVDQVAFQGVAWTGVRFVATGIAADGEGVFVDSADGLTWHHQAGAGATARPAIVAAGPLGVLAVGLVDERPASWFSPDGLAWTRQIDAFPLPSPGTDTFSVTAVTATDAGWLAVGREDPYCQANCGLAPVRAIAWTSHDGLHWTRVPAQASLDGSAMTAMSRGGPGYVAVGLAGTRAAAWTSTDGTSWARVPDAPLFHERPSTDPSLWTTMVAVAAGHGAVVAVGNEGPGGAHGPSARAWWSADGTVWATAEGDFFASGGEVSVIPTGVTATPDGFLAAASTNGGCTGGLWASTDGRTWRCVALDAAFAGFRPHAVAASGSVEIAVGLGSARLPSSEQTAGVVWRRMLP